MVSTDCAVGKRCFNQTLIQFLEKERYTSVLARKDAGRTKNENFELDMCAQLTNITTLYMTPTTVQIVNGSVQCVVQEF